MVPTPPPPDETPIDQCDPLVADVLRAVTECYIRGDYHGALARLQDARAFMAHRVDWLPLCAFLEQLDAALTVGVLCTHDTEVAADPRRI